MIKRLQALLLALVLAAGLTLAGCSGITQPAVDLGSVTIDSYQGDSPWVEVDGNQPAFSQDERESTEVFEEYSPLDFLGRCGVAYANLCPELMPTEERGAIGQIKPAGWHTVRYDWVDGEYLYNRCHLIGFQLAGENANERNLITGTRYMNTQGMLPFENLVAEYIHETGNHVLVLPRGLLQRGARGGHRLRHRGILGRGGEHHLLRRGDHLYPQHQFPALPRTRLRRCGPHRPGQPPGDHRQPGAPPGPGVPALRNLQTVTGTPDRNGHPPRRMAVLCGCVYWMSMYSAMRKGTVSSLPMTVS